MISILLALTIIPPLYLKEPLIQVSTDPKCRPSHTPLITGDTFRAFCPFIIDETGIPFEPDRLAPGDPIFVGMPYLDYFLQEILPLIETPFILVTSNGNGLIDERYRAYLDSPKILAWFGRNMTLPHSKARGIPLGFCWHLGCKDRQYHATLEKLLGQIDPEAYFRDKKVHTYCNLWLPSHPHRTDVVTHFQSQPTCKLSGQRPFPKYMSDLASARFVISARGVNIDCYRTWEALLAGSIPVVESEGIDSLYEDLPVIVVKELTQVTPEFLDREFEALKRRHFNFAKLTAAYWLDQIETAKKELTEAAQ